MYIDGSLTATFCDGQNVLVAAIFRAVPVHFEAQWNAMTRRPGQRHQTLGTVISNQFQAWLWSITSE